MRSVEECLARLAAIPKEELEAAFAQAKKETEIASAKLEDAVRPKQHLLEQVIDL